MLRIIYTTAAILFCYLFFLGASSGPTGIAGDRTGSPLSGGLCNACHASPGSFTPQTVITLRDSNNVQITNGMYIPGNSYTLTVAISSPSANNITPQYGMQAVILKEDNAQAGILNNPTTGLSGTGLDARIYNYSLRSYLEHTQRSVDGVFNATWLAPVKGSGTVTVYAIGQAVNANSAFTGDNFDTTSFTLSEDLSVGVNTVQNDIPGYHVFPSPAVNGKFFIDGINGEAVVRIYDLTGSLIYNKIINFESGIKEIITDSPKGVFFVNVWQNGKQSSRQLIFL